MTRAEYVTYRDERGSFRVLAPASNRARLAAEVAKRRANEAACALDYRVFGDEGDHDERCICDPPCSRAVDIYPPTPVFMEEQMQTGIEPPADESLYAGTGIGALYGLPGSERHAWQLAGWNVGRPG